MNKNVVILITVLAIVVGILGLLWIRNKFIEPVSQLGLPTPTIGINLSSTPYPTAPVASTSSTIAPREITTTKTVTPTKVATNSAKITVTPTVNK